ncbi:MAG: hypothetical protein ACKOUR_17960 [Planctomycetota bacterium]
MTTHATKLELLRRRLADLRRARQTVRWGAAYSASLVAVLLLLGGLWALDVMFELSVLQRAVMMALAAAGAMWSFIQYTRPLLGVQESEVDLALQVERQQGIDSDLVAALQFETPAAAAWGSRELSSAVIDRVSNWGATLDVFRGFSREQLRRRAWALALTVGAAVLATILFPQHARVFVNRLLLGQRHYPTRTVLERIIVGDSLVLAQQRDDTQPRSFAAAQGQNLGFLVVCTGETPRKVTARLQALTGGTSRVVELTAVDESERQQRLEQIQARLRAPMQGTDGVQESEDSATMLATLQAEFPEVAERWRAASESRASWEDVTSLFEESFAGWERTATTTRLYRGELGRLVDSARYKLQAGDAWTDPADITMTLRPTVELSFTTESPDYARGSDAVRELGPRQLSVLEGSRVGVQIACSNGKPLKEVWLTWKSPEGTQRVDLEPAPGDDRTWKLPDGTAPFSAVSTDVRFAVQVRDEDELGLETPVAGLIRIKSDRPPTGSLDVVHKVVLPIAKPIVSFRASDDYGIAKVLLHLEHERAENKRAGQAAENSPTASNTASNSVTESPDSPSSETVEARRQTVVLQGDGAPLRAASLPLVSQKEIQLAPLAMVKGDRLRMTLEVMDDRGSKPGVSYLSEPLYLEISDEAGVLTAILEADEKSEQRLSDLIKRQLGIREAP